MDVVSQVSPAPIRHVLLSFMEHLVAAAFWADMSNALSQANSGDTASSFELRRDSNPGSFNAQNPSPNKMQMLNQLS